VFKNVSFVSRDQTLTYELYVLFGKSGSGKNFVGRAFTQFGFSFYDGDDSLGPELEATVRNKEPLTMDMLDDYFYRLIEDTKELLRTTQKLVVAQAVFQNKHREWFKEAFPTVKMVWLDTSDKMIRTHLNSRQNHIASTEYAMEINEFFQDPDFDCLRLTNNVRGEVGVLEDVGGFVDQKFENGVSSEEGSVAGDFCS
jgi:gluconate kinase